MYEVKLNGTIVEVVRDKLTTGKDVLFGNFINMEDTFVFVSPSFLISFDKDQAIEE